MKNDTTLITTNTPQCLRTRRHWVCWRYELLANGEKTKVPYDARSGRTASTTNPATWTTFEQAVQRYEKGDFYNGVGYVFSKDDPYCGIDLDDCRHDDGTLAPWAQEIVDRFPSYCEISPSETGVKIFLQGHKPDFADCSVKNINPNGGAGELEVYDKSRYFCVTGNILPGSATDATDCQKALDELCRRYWSRKHASVEPQPQRAAASLPQEQMVTHQDDRVGRCLTAMLKFKANDRNDGSHRLFAAACRCVEHDLSDEQAIACVRAYAAQRPFPRDWTDAQIVRRLRDAEKECVRGKALVANGGSDSATKKRSLTISEILVEIASTAELAHDENRIGYARIEVDGHEETWRVQSQGFRQYLSRRLYEQGGKAAYTEAMRTALDLIEAKAIHDGQKVAVFVRVGEQEGAMYLDLADEQWRVARVTTSGWKVLDRSPVWFRRSRGMLPLPMPQASGSIDELRRFLNYRDDADFVLLVAWLLAALCPTGPYPILNVCGEQGSAKSTMQRLLRSLVDPNAAPLRNEPREPRDLSISASNSWVLAFDNLSNISPWLSDAFCRLSTGGGSAFRQLYSNDEEVIFDAKRPLMFNGISDIVSRGDLLDRCITIMLQAIPPAKRRDERTLWVEFERARPRILGALLAAVAAGLTYRQSIHIDAAKKPRMLDLALWVTACERGLPWETGAFLNAYDSNRRDTNSIAIEASPIGQAVRRLMETRCKWKGTSSQLLRALEDVADEKTCQGKDWPRTGRKVAGDLRRIAPNLRAEDIDVQFLPRTGQARPIVIQRTSSDGRPLAGDGASSQLSPPPQCRNTFPNKPLHSRDDSYDGSDGIEQLL